MPYEQRPVPVCGCGDHEPHVHLVVPIVLASAVLFVLLLVGSFLAASRSSSDGSPRQATTGVPSPIAEGLGWDPGSAAEASGTPPSPAPANVAGSEGASALTTPMSAITRYTGTATWYCGHGAACTRGYRPSDLIAAIDRKDTTFRKGDRVVVRYGRKHVTVRIVDVCACVDRRVIDLSTGAFLRLAPLGLGVLPVTVELAEPGVTPPQTDR